MGGRRRKGRRKTRTGRLGEKIWRQRGLDRRRERNRRKRISGTMLHMP